MLLTPNQQATRQALVDVAIELATEGGYDAVAMPEVARRASMSTAKAYQHIGTKDQLLVEALLSLGQRSTEDVERHQNTGDTPAERLRWEVGRIMKAVAARPLLYRALYRAYVTNGAAFEGDNAIVLGPHQAAWISKALTGGATVGYTKKDLDAAARIFSCMIQGGIVSVAAGRSISEITAVLDEAINRLLPAPSPSTGTPRRPRKR
ncbi:TetR/AcrR family transcriptional regulator [Mycolicibacterium moriokaense]|uniref:TetR family transcriptional regulator n=1 Tax=Mycolicibacterium moriokaense TaxID=39691 RepID=A0A318HAI2_9MYCO|nr:TetR/AcrR family transcriptional regulator [Mycolicibacterium moriokaense]PXX00791.1 TetR family transcriptional regulator [Mycolicibacterium moriokaense]